MLRSILKAVLVLLLSGFAYYYGEDFHFQWWLMWLAPIPILVYVYRENSGRACIVAFLLGMVPGMNGIINYWGHLPVLFQLIATVMQSLCWVIVILMSRAFMRRHVAWISVWMYPVLLTLFEWIQSIAGKGIFNSIALSQLPALPVMQIASLTGFIGVTFIVSLFASAVACAVVYDKDRKAVVWSSLVSGIIILSSLGYGFYRMHSIQAERGAHTKVGLAAIEESFRESDDPALAEQSLQLYQPLIQKLAKQGAELVLLPEKVFTVNESTRAHILQQVENIAAHNHIMLIVGVSELTHAQRFNVAWLFDARGYFLGEYAKRHFVPVVEDGTTPGVSLLSFPMGAEKAGIAICRDMDYNDPVLQYSADNTDILFVPAWDFDVDAYVHNQGAFVRGIENGISLVRAARSGLLSVTLASGEILGVESNINKKPTTLLVNVPISTHTSFYSRHPYWFVGLLWIAFIVLMIFPILPRLRRY